MRPWKGPVRWHENGIWRSANRRLMIMSGADGDQKQRAGGREVVGETKTEIVHVVGEMRGSVPVGHCRRASILPEEMETGRRTACASDSADPADDRIVPEYWSGMLNLRVERVSAPR